MQTDKNNASSTGWIPLTIAYGGSSVATIAGINTILCFGAHVGFEPLVNSAALAASANPNVAAIVGGVNAGITAISLAILIGGMYFWYKNRTENSELKDIPFTADEKLAAWWPITAMALSALGGFAIMHYGLSPLFLNLIGIPASSGMQMVLDILLSPVIASGLLMVTYGVAHYFIQKNKEKDKEQSILSNITPTFIGCSLGSTAGMAVIPGLMSDLIVIGFNATKLDELYLSTCLGLFFGVMMSILPAMAGGEINHEVIKKINKQVQANTVPNEELELYIS